jgi:hypothetical protein
MFVGDGGLPGSDRTQFVLQHIKNRFQFERFSPALSGLALRKARTNVARAATFHQVEESQSSVRFRCVE